MKKLAIIISLFIFSCSDSSTGPQGLSLDGTLTIQGQPLDNASVQVDDNLNWRTNTNENGYFKVTGLTEGAHIFKASKKESNEQLVSIESTVNLTDETTSLGEIRLPIPPFMYDIDTLNVSSNAIPLRWSRSTDPEFREYKVYRRDTPGLDETTGELIFVSTSEQDTTYIDKPSDSAKYYYYRVYVLSAFGKLGGSNLVDVFIPPVNLVRNPSFEESSDGIHPDIWKEYAWNCPSCGGQVTDILLDSDAKHGEYSGKLIFDGTLFPQGYPDGELSLSQQIDKTSFHLGEEYELSMWIKTSNLNVWIAFVKDYNNWQVITKMPEFNWIDKNTDWKKYSIKFIPVEEDFYSWEDPWLGIYINFPNDNETGFAWIDDIKLQKIPD